MDDLTPLGPALVTGGGGYFGRLLANRLARAGVPVRVLDVERAPGLDRAIEFVRGDIREPEVVARACEGRATVFHTAAVINPLTFARRKDRDATHAVNVGGTRHVVSGCRDAGVPRLVYTSSNNVVFDRWIEDGDEALPYARGLLDLYTTTKVQAEKLALAANGPDLAVCALRPGGIYGPGERHHLPRLVKELRAGKLVALVGSGRARADNIFVDSLVEAHVCAALRLAPGAACAGKAYFISDGEPTNYFEFFRPLIEDLGYRVPRLWVPRALMTGLAAGAELTCLVTGGLPFMTLMEVRKVAVSHYFSIEAARRDLGWEPSRSMAEALDLCKPYVRKLHAGEPVSAELGAVPLAATAR